MKQLADITYHQFQCGFCKRIYKTELGARKHEDKCYKNPERNCVSCDNTGIQVSLIFNPKSIMSPPATESRPCDACTTAEKLGGKSYLVKGGLVNDGGMGVFETENWHDFTIKIGQANWKFPVRISDKDDYKIIYYGVYKTESEARKFIEDWKKEKGGK